MLNDRSFSRMTEEQKIDITKLVHDSLDAAECVWGEVGGKIMAKSASVNDALANMSAPPVPTTIPGHEFIENGKPLVDEFIAFVLDMRESSKHLNCAIADTGASELKRVYYETAAILPACSRIIKKNEGGVTEYLGDGFLAFFRVEKDNKAKACYYAHDAARDCIDAVKEIINPILKERYRLPSMHIGVGMAISKAVLTLIGETDFYKPTAFGKCVFYASKLSKGVDEVLVDEGLKTVWPTQANGPLKFHPHNFNGFKCYKMYCVKSN